MKNTAQSLHTCSRAVAARAGKCHLDAVCIKTVRFSSHWCHRLFIRLHVNAISGHIVTLVFSISFVFLCCPSRRIGVCAGW